MKEQLELLKDYLWYQSAGDVYMQVWFEESPFTIQLKEHFGIEFYKLEPNALKLSYSKYSEDAASIANKIHTETKINYDERDKIVNILNDYFRGRKVCVGALHFKSIKSLTINQNDKGEFTSVQLNNFKFRLEKPKLTNL